MKQNQNINERNNSEKNQNRQTNRFDDWESVQADCNTCENYWISSCDGVPIGKQRKCTTYRATRRVDVPHQIMKLHKDIGDLRTGLYAVILATMAITLVGISCLVRSLI